MVLSTTARGTPAGVPLDLGYQILIAFAANPTVSFWEKTVKPPGVDGGDAVEVTTQHNEDMRTFAARALKTLTDSNSTVAYDPRVYNDILALINVEGAITIHFPDGSTLDFYGFLRVFDPSDQSETAQPEATINITPTNRDPVTGEEVLPNYKTPAGTDV